MKLYCATANPAKLEEFRMAAEKFGRGLIELAPLPDLAAIPTPEETGASFEQNAIQKALYYSARKPGVMFADDSGLEVEALAGAPGVRSARFAGDGAGADANNRLLLRKLRGVADRRARFVCVLALAEDGRLVRTFEGVADGWISEEPRGQNGFGYDPLFYYPPLGLSFGELSARSKLEVSHRGRAMAALLDFLS